MERCAILDEIMQDVCLAVECKDKKKTTNATKFLINNQEKTNSLAVSRNFNRRSTHISRLLSTINGEK